MAPPPERIECPLRNVKLVERKNGSSIRSSGSGPGSFGGVKRLITRALL